MRHRYRYLISSNREAEISLVSTHPSLKKHGGFYTLDLYEEEAGDYELIKKLYHLLPAIIREYTSEELDTAPWLSITPLWSAFFPYPDEDYRKNICIGHSNCRCGTALVQVRDFCVDAKIKKMKYPFLQLNWVFDELFISTKVRDTLMSSDLRGYGIRNTWIKGSNEMQPDTFQLTISTTIPHIFDLSKMIVGPEDTCVCGTKRRFLHQQSPLKLNYNAVSNIDKMNIDIFKAGEFFGSGGIWMQKIFISQSFYRVLKTSGFDSSLRIELPEIAG